MTQAQKRHPAARQPAERYFELHRAIAALLKKNRFVRNLTASGLSRAEIHALIEIDARGESTIKALQPLLNMDQSSISRLIKALVNDNRLQSKPSTKDKRVRLLSLTKDGQKTVAQIDKLAGALFDQYISRLSKAESRELLKFFEDVANWYRHPVCPARDGEDQIRMQQRRMTRAIGVLHKNVFESGLSSAQWNVFSEICYSQYPVNPTQLSENQNIPANSLSIILEKLVGMGFIARTQASHDSRYVELRASKQGKAFLKKVETRSAQDLADILADHTEKQVTSLVQILHKYLGEPAGNDSYLPSTYEIRQVQPIKIRDSIRTFVLEELVHAGQARFVPAQVIAPTSLVFGLYDNQDTLLAACEVAVNGESPKVTLLAAGKRTPPGTSFAFLKSVLTDLASSQKWKQVKIAFEPALELLKNAGVRHKGQIVKIESIY